VSEPQAKQRRPAIALGSLPARETAIVQNVPESTEDGIQKKRRILLCVSFFFLFAAIPVFVLV
jgi:hypothetical protein